jgi:hypothetical protein
MKKITCCGGIQANHCCTEFIAMPVDRRSSTSASCGMRYFSMPSGDDVLGSITGAP